MKLPDGWKIIKLNDVAVPLKRRNTIGNRNVLTSSAQFGLINQMEYHNRSMAGEDLSSYYLLYNGDFAYNRSSAKEYPFGAIRRLDKFDTGIVSSLYIPFTLKKDSCFSDFLAYVLDSELINQYLYQVCQEGARNHGLLNIAKEDFFQMPLYLPICQNEQRRIAEFLGTWDEAIEKLEQLIAAKEKLHNHLINELFFSATGIMVAISDFAQEISWKSTDFLTLTVLSCTKYDGLVDSEKYFGRRVYGSDLSKYKTVPYGCFAYATNHIEEGAIGLQMQYDLALISPMYTVFRIDNKKIDPLYLFYLLKSPHYVREFKKRTEGSVNRRGGLHWHSFSQIKVKLPNVEIQKDIAKILKYSQAELDLLNKKLAALQKQKRGLMQKLLTGTWRV